MTEGTEDPKVYEGDPWGWTRPMEVLEPDP